MGLPKFGQKGSLIVGFRRVSLMDMDDLLSAKKTETSSGAAGKGTPMNAMKPMGSTKMGQGSGGCFGAQEPSKLPL